MADGFLGRWSQRKAQVRAGKVPVEPIEPALAAPITSSPAVQEFDTHQAFPATTEALSADKAPPAPTLQEAQALRLDSDFRPFAARGLDPAVRNAAMKKLFADPHFNVMDRMDVYIDDYSLPDPLSAIDLRQMASAQFLKLVDDEAEPVHSAVSSPPVSTAHADPDLQLQQDPAPQSPSPGERTE